MTSLIETLPSIPRLGNHSIRQEAVKQSVRDLRPVMVLKWWEKKYLDNQIVSEGVINLHTLLEIYRVIGNPPAPAPLRCLKPTGIFSASMSIPGLKHRWRSSHIRSCWQVFADI